MEKRQERMKMQWGSIGGRLGFVSDSERLVAQGDRVSGRMDSSLRIGRRKTSGCQRGENLLV